MLFGSDINSVSIVSKERHIGNERIVFIDNALLERDFFLNHSAEHTHILLVLKLLRRIKLKLYLLGHNGEAVHLTVRMRHGHTHNVAAVFEDEHVFEYEYDKDYPFAAFVTNLGKYNEGELVGEWVKFPTTPEEMQAVFQRIGIGETDDFRRCNMLLRVWSGRCA